MKTIWHISDTHGYHNLLDIPSEIDMVIFSGDCSNPRNPYINENEVRVFMEWYSKLPIKHKIFVAGNHDSSIEKRLITKKDFTNIGITYLENESMEIEGINIFGSPVSLTFNDWCFMKARDKTYKLWETIPENTDIVITHTPPKGILDMSYDKDNVLEFCGCNSLKKRMFSMQPELHLFGHIHNTQDIINAGQTKLSEYKTTFSNGSVVTDGKFGRLSSNGNIFKI